MNFVRKRVPGFYQEKIYIKQRLMRNILEILFNFEYKLLSECICGRTQIHGLDHLRNVGYLSGKFAAELGISLETAIIGGFLHDCARSDDSDDAFHAEKSALLARKLIKKNYSNIDEELVYKTILFHSGGKTTDNHIQGCVWDADRLDLIRLGIQPKKELLSTEPGKRFYNKYFESNQYVNNINKLIDKILSQRNANEFSVISIWLTHNSERLLRIIRNLLLKKKYDFTKLIIISLFEYPNLNKRHDFSTCYRIYKIFEDEVNLSQVICPVHNSKLINKYSSYVESIIGYDSQLSPYYKNSGDTNINIESNEIINNLSRYFEKYDNTPTSIIQFPQVYYNSIKSPIVLLENKEDIKLVPNIWKKNVNSTFNPLKYY